MSKNIFAALETKDDSDQEVKAEVARKPTKKELRAEDQVKREHYGDKVVKDEHKGPIIPNKIKNKGDYGPGEKRPFERHSGTGKPAFTNDFKKGGFGKGNVGVAENEQDAKIGKKSDQHENGEEEKKDDAKIAPTPEPVEQIITLDEYVAKSGLNLQFIDAKNLPTQHSVKITDSTVKVMQAKIKDNVEYSKKGNKNVDNFVGLQNNPLLFAVENPIDGKRRVSKRNIKTDFNEQNFPALS